LRDIVIVSNVDKRTIYGLKIRQLYNM
jgi:hypothetical protein